MELSNIVLGVGVVVDPSSSINNVVFGDGVKVAKRCSIFGSKKQPLILGHNCYVGMNTVLNGFKERLQIGNNVSIAQSVNIMTDSGPNASEKLQRIFPLIVGPVVIGDDSWIGANAVIMPGVTLGSCCVVAANSFVNKSFESGSVIGGNPARLLKKIELP